MTPRRYYAADGEPRWLVLPTSPTDLVKEVIAIAVARGWMLDRRDSVRLNDTGLVEVRLLRYASLRMTGPSSTAAKYLSDTPPGRRGINLGCGAKTFRGWLNIDMDRTEPEISWDLTKGLPFLRDGQFDAIYSEHFLEHIPRKAASALLSDCFRVLRPGGHIRLALPGLDECIRAYQDGDRYPNLNEAFREDLGGVLHTRGELFNIAMRGWGHTYIYNREDIGLVLERAGFADIRSAALDQSEVDMLRGRETRPADQSSLIVEARKPG